MIMGLAVVASFVVGMGCGVILGGMLAIGQQASEELDEIKRADDQGRS